MMRSLSLVAAALAVPSVAFSATFAFRDAVLSTPNLAAVMTGHIHTLLAGCERGKYMFTTPTNRKGDFLDVSFTAK